jgi:uncharacterized membrane protein (UPF0127 family)
MPAPMSKKHKQIKVPAQKKKNPTSVVAIVGTILLLLALIAVFTYQPSSRTPVSTPTSTNQSNQPSAYEFVKQGEVRFMTSKQSFITAIEVELAQDDAERQLGLMYRDKMAENQGMLFIFEGEQTRSFWMKNTVLPLDMLFINAKNEIVTIHKSTTPYSEESYASTKPAKYVLEVNAGFTEKHKIAVGNRIAWRQF